MENSSSQANEPVPQKEARIRDLPIRNWWSSFAAFYSGFNVISMMIFTTLIFLFLRKPIGAVIGNGLIVVWLYLHFDGIKRVLHKIIRSSRNSTDDESSQESIWFLVDVKEKIISLMSSLSIQGIHYCNLVDYIQLPPCDTWQNIAYSLHREGIKTEVTESSFLIQWSIV